MNLNGMNVLNLKISIQFIMKIKNLKNKKKTNNKSYLKIRLRTIQNNKPFKASYRLKKRMISKLFNKMIIINKKN